MAGIEKICELSGEYPGWLMYGYKRDHIQIMPQCRKRFAGAEHTLHIFKPGRIWVSGNMSRSYRASEMNSYEPAFTDEALFIAYTEKFTGWRLRQEFEYCLEVTDPALAGEVNGLYLNYTRSIGAVKRRLKRMLKCRKLRIQRHDCSYSDFRQARMS